MRSTTPTFKQIMASGNARKYLIKIDLELADNTVLHLTQDDIWEDSFGISTASSGTSTFDIGTAVIGKCKFTINNIDGDFDSYDFFNADATVWLGLVGDETGSPAVQQYYRMGFYTVDEPSKANGLISLELLDNMWKFDVPLPTITYPATAGSIVQTLCTYCGVILNTQQFHGYNFSIAEAPKDADKMNCRELLQYIAMIGCNFCMINNDGSLSLKWYDVNATSSTTDVFDRNFSTSFGTDDITVTGVKFVIDSTEYSRGTSGYVLELTNPLVTATNVSSVLDLIWANGYLKDFTLRTFNLTTASDLAAEIGDKCKIKDYKGNYVYSWITTNSFKLTAHQLQCNAQSPNRTLTKRYSETVKAAVEEARVIAEEAISTYDLDVQELNKLVEQSMGAYTEYEEAQSGGRIYYISDMPITKSSAGVCSFEPNSIVWRMAGDVFSVSTDGGQTWVNGYNPQTGKLVVNVLSAIGISFDWARGGTLTLGGYGNGNGVLSIQNASNVEKVHGDNTGIAVGGTTGSKIFINTDGELRYLFNNVYSGKIRMETKSYGSQDTQDSLSVEDFHAISLSADNNANLILREKNNVSMAKLSADDSVVISSGDTVDIESSGDTSVTASDLVLLNGGDGVVFGQRGIGSVPVIYPNGYTGNNDPVGVTDGFRLTNGANTYDYQFYNGILTGAEYVGPTPHNYWHSWEESGSTIASIILGVGATQAQFPSIDNTLAYEPFIQCADGVEAPLLTGTSISGTTFTAKFTAVTSAQVGSGNQCIIKLLTIRAGTA